MPSSTHPPLRRHRRHGAVIVDPDRRALERAGWRTVLDYREDHVRGCDGQLLRVTPTWVAVAERCQGGKTIVLSACRPTPHEAWADLRARAEATVVIEARARRPESRVPSPSRTHRSSA